MDEEQKSSVPYYARLQIVISEREICRNDGSVCRQNFVGLYMNNMLSVIILCNNGVLPLVYRTNHKQVGMCQLVFLF